MLITNTPTSAKCVCINLIHFNAIFCQGCCSALIPHIILIFFTLYIKRSGAFEIRMFNAMQ